MLKAVIVDDEKNGREVIELLLKEYCPEVKVFASVESVQQAIESFVLHEPDLVFLDIKLSNGTGFDILDNPEVKQLNFKVIFTTAYEKFAVQAIKNDAIDYLLKPIDGNELKTAVNKAGLRKNQDIKNLLQDIRQAINPKFKLKLATRKGFELIDISDIIYCKSEANYTRFYLKNTTKLTSKTLKTYQSILEKNGFMRVHKGHIVNLNEIQLFTHGKISLITMSNNQTLSINKDSKKLLLDRLDLS